MPNVLFFLIYHSASWFGENHFAISKLLNAAFFGMSILPLYAVAREFLSKTGAYFFSVAVVFSPISSYSVYMMPEALFFFAFWVLAYVVVVKLPTDIIYGGVYLGFATAALSAIKPHGLIIAGTFPVVFSILYFCNPDRMAGSQLVEGLIGCLEAFVVGRFAIQYVAHGDFTVMPFGTLYQAVARRPPAAVVLQWTGKSANQSPAVLGLGHFLWHFLEGHLAYLSVLFWPALLLAFWPSEPVSGTPRERLSYRLLLGLLLSALTLFLAAAAVVGVDFASLFDVELCRLHGRYYDFVFPGLVLVFLVNTHRNRFHPRATVLFKIAAIVGAIAAGALVWYARSPYCVNFVDFPEIRWLAASELHLSFAVTGCILTAITLAFCNALLARIVYCGALVVWALLSSAAIFRDQVAQVAGPPPEDLAGIAVRNLLREQVDDGIVFSKVEHDPRSYRVMLQLYSLSERRVLDQPVLSNSDIPPGVKWILMLDRYRVEVPYYTRIAEQGFELITLSPDVLSASAGSNLESYPRFYDLSRNGTRQVSLSGFNLREESSAWTRDAVARVYFDAPISGRVQLTVKAHAYGPNSGRPVTLKVGNLERQASFFGSDSEVNIGGELKDPADFVEFSGMAPISPAEFEHATDPRPLGIAVSSIRVSRIEEPVPTLHPH